MTEIRVSNYYYLPPTASLSSSPHMKGVIYSLFVFAGAAVVYAPLHSWTRCGGHRGGGLICSACVRGRGQVVVGVAIVYAPLAFVDVVKVVLGAAVVYALLVFVFMVQVVMGVAGQIHSLVFVFVVQVVLGLAVKHSLALWTW